MSELKCPFCNQELDIDLKGECGCINEQCQKSVFMFGSPELWQELIRTRKALETIRLHLMTAKGRFNLYDEYLVSGMDSPDARFIKEEIDKAIEQITALEQKDK